MYADYKKIKWINENRIVSRLLVITKEKIFKYYFQQSVEMANEIDYCSQDMDENEHNTNELKQDSDEHLSSSPSYSTSSNKNLIAARSIHNISSLRYIKSNILTLKRLTTNIYESITSKSIKFECLLPKYVVPSRNNSSNIQTSKSLNSKNRCSDKSQSSKYAKFRNVNAAVSSSWGDGIRLIWLCCLFVGQGKHFFLYIFVLLLDLNHR